MRARRVSAKAPKVQAGATLSRPVATRQCAFWAAPSAGEHRLLGAARHEELGATEIKLGGKGMAVELPWTGLRVAASSTMGALVLVHGLVNIVGISESR
jgi:hypothetical protein